MKYVKGYYVDAKDGRPANKHNLRHGPALPSDDLTVDAVDRRQRPSLIIGTLPDNAEVPTDAMEEITEEEHAELMQSYNDWRDAFEANQLELYAEQMRKERNKLLSDSDWTQVSDAPVDHQAWADYRQALRDVPQQDGFPSEVEWPTPPQAIL